MTIAICALHELPRYGSRGVTHTLSILDPNCPEPAILQTYDQRHRMVLRFHDAVAPGPGIVMPSRDDIRAIIEFGRSMGSPNPSGHAAHLLVHCHAGISRATAAAAIVLAQAHPEQDEDSIFAHILKLRSQAWPNHPMIALADGLLSRGGRLTQALRRFYILQLTLLPKTRAFVRETGLAHEFPSHGSELPANAKLPEP